MGTHNSAAFDGVLGGGFGMFPPRPGRSYYVAAGGNQGSELPKGSDSYTGKSWDQPFLTLAEALSRVKTFDTVYIMGDVREEAMIGSNLAMDVRLVGVGGRHHPDVPSALYHPGSAMIRPPASPTAATDLLTIRGRGWELWNLHFDAPVDASALVGISNNGSGVSEYDASHMGLYRCTFQQGKYGFTASGGLANVEIFNCVFRIMSAASGVAIREVTGAGVRANQFWHLKGNRFPAAATVEGNKGNQSHLIAGLHSSLIEENVFGTVESTGLYVNLTGGQDNTVTKNVMHGNYATDDYVAGTGDAWYENYCKVTATTAPDGRSILPPAA